MPRTQFDGQQILDDSITGDDVREESLSDSKIPFVEAGFSALNVHDAIIEAKLLEPFYGSLDQNITVPVDRAMIMINPIINNYEIKIHGELRIL